MQRQIDSGCNNANELLAINIKLKENERLEKIIKYKTKGAMLWAKCGWYNEGGKNFKAFP